MRHNQLRIAIEQNRAQIDFYHELMRSLPNDQRDDVVKMLDESWNEPQIVERAESLCVELSSGTHIAGLESKYQSWILFLAALKNLKDGKITAEQLATIHLLVSAFDALYLNPYYYLIYQFVENNTQHVTRCVHEVMKPTSIIEPRKWMPCIFQYYQYNAIVVPNVNTEVSSLPLRMQSPLMKRFFNFTDSEWKNFCVEMSKAHPSEQVFEVLKSPHEGCYSSIIARAQELLMCMRTLDQMTDSENGLMREKIMLVPSFTMFQAALNAKAITLNRKPVKLIPTYGYIEPHHYAELKASGEIAFALMPPLTKLGETRNTVDGHPQETAFAGAIHDMYHAMREMSMSEDVAKARMRLAEIAKNHPNNKRDAASRPVDEILVDGELIFSYDPSIDTMFDPECRPPNAEKFGDLFYIEPMKRALDENLKRAFIEDMVVNEWMWKRFKITKDDLRGQDQVIFDEIKSQHAQKFKSHDSRTSPVVFFPNSTQAECDPRDLPASLREILCETGNSNA